MKNPIHVFALVCVAITSFYVMYVGWELIKILSGPSWCAKALGAEKASSTTETVKGLDACVDLLTIQLKSLATNSHIMFGVIALCLLVLMVLVIAGGYVNISFSKSGGTVGIGREKTPAVEAAMETAEAAVGKAQEIAETEAEDVTARGTVT